MNRPAFKNSELGPIPADWEVKRLGEILTFKNGCNAPAEAYGKGCPFISVLDILGRSPMTIASIRGKVAVDSGVQDVFSAQDGDLFFMRSSETLEDVGKSNVFHGENDCALFGGFVIRGRPVAEVDAVFLNYLLQDEAHRKRISAKGAGAQHFNIGQAGLSTVEITLPPLSEQHRIAAALSDADAWIESLDKLIEKKKLVKQGAMQALLSGKTRLPGFSGKWEERRLGEIGVFRKGSGISREEGRSGNIPAIRYGELYTHHDCIIRAFASHISEAVASRATLLKPGDILFACSGETKEEIGKCAAFIQPVRAYAGGDLLIMTPDPALCDSMFLGYALNTAECQIQKSAAGQGDAVVHIHKDALEEIAIRLPSTLAEQTAIAAVLSDMDAELASLSREKAKAEQIKQGMMQELLTGRVRLTGGE